MGIKNRILSIVSIMALAIILTFVGVWAVADLDFAVGGDITYTAPEPEPAVPVEDLRGQIFSYDEKTMEACLEAVLADEVQFVPARILKEGKIYTVTNILPNAFLWGSLPDESVTIYENVQYIGHSINKYLFCFREENNNATSYNIHPSCKTIGSEAFYQCNNVTNITIPESVTSVGGFAFDKCPNLKIINIKATIPPIGNVDMFIDCHADLVIYVPSESVEAYKNAEYWGEYNIQAGNF